VSIAPNYSDYHGQSPCIEPHILGRLLDKLEPLRAKIRNERDTAAGDAWAGIDAMAEAMEAAR
jgi:hypothetical protein